MSLILSEHERESEQARETLENDDVGEQDDDDDDDVSEQVHQVLGQRSVLQGSESQRFTNIWNEMRVLQWNRGSSTQCVSV